MNAVLEGEAPTVRTVTGGASAPLEGSSSRIESPWPVPAALPPLEQSP